MKCLTVILFLAVLGATFSSAVICTEYAKAGGGGDAPESYYKRPIPSSCRAQKLQGWTPKFRITEPMSECKEGWKKHRGSCYRLADGRRIMSFREGEMICNKHQGHIFVPKDRADRRTVQNIVGGRNQWYYLGIFCGRGKNLRNAYTVTGEDMRQLAGKWGMSPVHPLNNRTHLCYIWFKNHRYWDHRLHYQSCHERRGVICESPLAEA